MHKSTLAKLVLSAGLLVAANANAAMIKNGIRYAEYYKTARCLDGSAKLKYGGKYWCPTYGVSISWKPPVTRTNGTPLSASEIAAYEVYWTREVDTAAGTLKKTNTTVSTLFYVFTPDIYHFAMAAVDSKGLKSPLSTMVSAKLSR